MWYVGTSDKTQEKAGQKCKFAAEKMQYGTLKSVCYTADRKEYMKQKQHIVNTLFEQGQT